MSRESAQTKGGRYLREARLTVEHVDALEIRATCRGSGAIYRLAWTPSDEWTCDCPAYTTCAHLYALQAVTVREASE